MIEKRSSVYAPARIKVDKLWHFCNYPSAHLPVDYA